VADPLADYLRARRRQHEILLMTHIVIGYPDLDTSLRLVEAMVEAGVDLMELQIPFSEPIADGPAILHANQEALNGGPPSIGASPWRRRSPGASTFPSSS